MKFRRLIYLLVVLVPLVAYVSTLPKGIWADEVLQFAPAGFPSLAQATHAIFTSIRNVNHGQTGFHMLLNTVMLRMFGASYFVLRLPSYFAYAVGVTAGFLYLSELGVSLAVCLLFALLFGLSQLSLEHGWEARPYILLQACVMAFLWGWHRYASGRRGGFLIVALSGFAGILFHPFFIAYAGMIGVGSVLFISDERSELLRKLRFSREILPAAGLGLFFFGLFLAVGVISWFATQGHKFGLDPYEYVKHDKSLARFMVGTFFYPVSILAAPALALLTLMLIYWRRRPDVMLLVGPYFSLILNVVITQMVITFSVIHSQYWILQRQWVAGNALSFVAAALLIEFFVRFLRFNQMFLAGLAIVTAAIGVILLGIGIHGNLVVPTEPTVPFAQTEAFRARVSAQKEISMQDFQALAHQNLLLGGPVWPVFQRYYEDAGVN